MPHTTALQVTKQNSITISLEDFFSVFIKIYNIF